MSNDRDPPLSRSPEDDFANLRAVVACKATRGIYDAGKILCEQGEPSKTVSLIEVGLVKLRRRCSNGGEVVVGTRGHGGLIGSGAALLNCAQPCTAVALTECNVLQVAATVFATSVSANADALQAVARIHCRDDGRCVDRLVALAAESARSRLESLLRDFARTASTTLEDGSVRLNLSIPHYEWAQLIHVTPETFSRLLGDLEAAGTIARNKGRVILHYRVKDGTHSIPTEAAVPATAREAAQSAMKIMSASLQSHRSCK